MRGKRCKTIRKLVSEFDAGLLTSVREIHGDKTKEMDPTQLYNSAKKIWKLNLTNLKDWGKYSLKEFAKDYKLLQNESEQVNNGNDIPQ